MKRWRVVRSIIDFPSSRNGGSLANISHHLRGQTNVDVWTLARALSLELGSQAGNEFGSSLHAAFRKRGSTSDSHATVDVRHIITIYRASILASSAFTNPQGVLVKLLQQDCDIYESCRLCDKDSFLLAGIARVLFLAAVTDEEVNTMKECFRQLTTSLPNDESIITIEMLMKALQMHPTVLHNFQGQLVSKLPDNQRLKLLYEEEEKALRAFQRYSTKVISKKRLMFFSHKLLRRILAVWRLDLKLALHEKRKRKKNAFEAWLLAYKRIRLSRLFTNISHVNYCKSRLRGSIRKLVKWNRNMKKIKRCYTSVDEKNISAGVGHVRICINKVMVRRAIYEWIAFKDLALKADCSQRWYQTKVLRRAFRKFNSFSRSEIQSRRAARKAEAVRKHIQNIESSLLTPHRGSNVVQDTLQVKNLQTQQYEEARQRQIKLQKQIDANILVQQREHRRERVVANCKRREKEFQSMWAAKKLEEELECLDKQSKSTQSKEIKNQSQKRVKQIQRQLSIQHASTLNKDREDAITSPAIINYSILDVRLKEGGIVPDELFLSLEKMKSPIHSVPFQAALVSCGLSLDANEFEKMFHAMVQYKQTQSATRSLKLDNLREIRKLSNTFVGEEGTRWKMYVCPVHQQLMLHNIITDEKIYEKDIKKKHIRRMIIENMKDNELLKVRRKIFIERCIAYKAMVEYHAANSIQSMYYQWSGRQSIKKQLWAVERRQLFRLRARQAHAVVLIQRQFRSSRK